MPHDVELGRCGDRVFHLLQAGACDLQSVLFPVVAVEQFQGQHGLSADRQEIADDILDGRDTVAGIDAMLVFDRFTRRIGRIIIEMEDLERLRSKQFGTYQVSGTVDFPRQVQRQNKRRPTSLELDSARTESNSPFKEPGVLVTAAAF